MTKNSRKPVVSFKSRLKSLKSRNFSNGELSKNNCRGSWVRLSKVICFSVEVYFNNKLITFSKKSDKKIQESIVFDNWWQEKL